jgi:hypothetical protein
MSNMNAHKTYLARFVRVRTDGQETRPAVSGIKVHLWYFRSVHVETCGTVVGSVGE